MRRLWDWTASLDDRINPVAVKEFRQAVNSRWVVGVFLLFLLVNLGILAAYLTTASDAGTSLEGGRGVFSALFAILLVTCIGFVPLYAGIRLTLERNDANMDLFFVTTITPGAIVRGKYLSAIALTLLIFSACTPFLLLTYLLRGIDLPTILLLLANAFLLCVLANAMAILAGSVSGSALARGVVDAAVLIGLFSIASSAIGMSQSAVMFGMGTLGLLASWGPISVYLLSGAAGVGLLYVLSVALLSPKPSNRMLVPRLYITATWGVMGLVMAFWCWHEKSPEPMLAWLLGSGTGLALFMVAALGERDTWSARVRQTIPRNRFLRLAAFLLYSGSAGGILWCVLLYTATLVGWGVALVLAVASGAGSRWSPDMLEFPRNMSYVFGYALCYCLTTAALRPVVFRRLPTPHLSVIAAFVGTAAWLVPYFAAFLLTSGPFTEPSWSLLGSPMVLTTRDTAAKAAVAPFLLTWLGLSGLFSAPWAIGQFRRFAPYQDEPVPVEHLSAAGEGAPGEEQP